MSVSMRMLQTALLAMALLLTLSARAAEPVSDVRVLIDVSGSMKHNDPHNLRVPAMRMLVGLMPPDSRAGVWTFARYVNMLLPWRDVSPAWREEGEAKLAQIHAHGLFTDIEQVLDTALLGQTSPDPRFRRSMILLSDGFVDIEPDGTASGQSRQRILQQIVPRLKRAGITVHTIALSDQADHALLRALSLATDGWYQQADNSDDLQRIFLHLFEKSVPRDSVPLEDNTFTIDDSVSQMTVLAFRRPDTNSTRLVHPDGTLLGREDVSGRLRWLHESGFDLITLDDPAPGTWRIDADLDPDNRVMIVTDMKLDTTDLPNNLLFGEKLDFEASLTEQGERITRDDFLDLVDARLQHHVTDGAVQEESLRREGDEGIHRAVLGRHFQYGRNDIIVTMKSATFERERRQSIDVQPLPFDIDSEPLAQPVRSHRIRLQADDTLVQTGSLMIKALLKTPGGQEWPYEMLRTADNHWQLTLTDLDGGQDYELSVQIRGDTHEGRPFFVQAPALLLQDPQPVQGESEAAGTAEPEVVTPVEADDADPVADTVTDTVTGDDTSPVEAASMTSQEDADTGLSPNAMLLIGNMLILLLLAAGIWWWRRQSAMMVKTGDMI